MNDASGISDYEEEYSSDWGDYISYDIKEDAYLCPEDSESGITGQASGVCIIVNRNYNPSDFTKAKSEDDYASRQKVYEYIEKYAKQYNLNFNLVRAIIQTETEWKEDKPSVSGAYGLMQLKPDTSVDDLKKGTCSRIYGSVSINPYNTEQNIKGGIMYLNCMLTLFKGNFPLALAAYRVGPTAMAKNCKKDIYSCNSNVKSKALGYVERVRVSYEGFIIKSSKIEKTVIAVDPGHGGSDPGTVSASGLKEKDINLEIGLKLKNILEEQGYQVIMTREKDIFISLSQRAKMANNANSKYFISIHSNSAEDCTDRYGTVTYYFSEKGKELAELVQENIVAAVGTRDIGILKGNFQVLRETEMPGILVEAGYLCNEKDAEILTQPSEQENIALAISQSIRAFA